MADVKSSGLSVQVDVDVSEGLKGLKALQREAKETMKVLKELESLSPKECKSLSLAQKALNYSIELGVLFTDLNENIRAIGKTTALIEKAYELNIPIIVGNTSSLRVVKMMSKNMSTEVECYSARHVDELRGRRFTNQSFLVDDSVANKMILEIQSLGFKCVGGFNSLRTSI